MGSWTGFGNSEDALPEDNEGAFLGTAGWYRRFVKNFATLAAPLSKSLKKAGNTKFSLSPSTTQAVDDLKLALTSAPDLAHADFKKHFYIQCDAFHVGGWKRWVLPSNRIFP